MADDLTLAEIARNLARLEAGQQKLGDRIVESARESVSANLYAAEHQALMNAHAEHVRQSGVDRDRLERSITDLRKQHERDNAALRAALDREIEQARDENEKQIEALKKDREARAQWSWQKGLGLAMAVISIVGVIVAALAASKGIH
jgi:hypothetical protein